MTKHHVLSGVDCLEPVEKRLHGQRVGLMTNPTGVTHAMESTIDLFYRRFNLTALFGVEHGIRGDAQAGDEVGNTVDAATGVPVFSTYGVHREYTPEKLDAFDVLVFDMQDVGARFYTYLYSLANAMKACAKAGKAVVVLDRVNPLGGLVRQGTVIEEKFGSFVGNYALPTRYALTVGEYARYVKDYLRLDLDLTVVPLTGWTREMYLDDTDLPWVAPSPNCYDLATAVCYIGTCIFEGTNISEGRGTTQPFQLIGAPFLRAERLEKAMNEKGLPGLYFRRAYFRPTFSKHEGTPCEGVQMHVIDRDAADPFAGGLYLLEEILRQAGDKVEFLRWGENTVHSIDKLLGTDAFRTGRMTAAEVIAKGREDIAAFCVKVRPFELYA